MRTVYSASSSDGQAHADSDSRLMHLSRLVRALRVRIRRSGRQASSSRLGRYAKHKPIVSNRENRLPPL